MDHLERRPMLKTMFVLVVISGQDYPAPVVISQHAREMRAGVQNLHGQHRTEHDYSWGLDHGEADPRLHRNRGLGSGGGRMRDFAAAPWTEGEGSYGRHVFVAASRLPSVYARSAFR